MRLKTYIAPTTAEAMELVRREMGDDAIIVSTQMGSDGRGTRVTAALEPEQWTGEDSAVDAEAEPADVAGAVGHALTYHGTPPRLVERLLRLAIALEADNPTMALAGALDAGFTFAPLAGSGDGPPTMLVGPPGVGKTVTTAKLAARTRLARRHPGVITTDTRRAGGVAQLEAFTRILEIDLKTADTVEALTRAVAACEGCDGITIDTPGTNPYSDTELEELQVHAEAATAEPILVLAAGGDALEAADIAVSFAAVGARRLLVTRLDMARRLGSILAAADAARLSFCDVSITPHVADGLSPINPVALARLMMPDGNDANANSHPTKAAP